MKTYRQKINWLKVVLSIVTLVALILGYFYFFEDKIDDLIPNVISNLVAVLIAVPILYFVFTIWGISPQEELKEEIIEGISNLNDTKSGFDDDDIVNKRLNFKEKSKTIKQLDLIGLSTANFLTKFRPEITEALKRGCNFRFLTISSKSNAANLVMEHQSQGELEPDIAKAKARISQILKDLKDEKGIGKIELRGINWIPSCSILILDKEKLSGEMRVKVYPLVIEIPLRLIKTHTMVYKRFEPELFNYYTNHFDILWRKGNENE